MRFLILLLSICLPTALCAQTANLRGKVVGKIDIVVNKAEPGSAFDPDTVRARLKTKVGERFSQLDFDEDLKMLSDDFDRIEPKVDVVDDEVHVKLTLWPRPTIANIEWVGVDKLKEKSLNRELDIKPGVIFDRHAFNVAFNKVKIYTIKKGFFEAEMDYKVVPNAKSNDVNIVISVQEGRSGHIRGVSFEGFTKKEQKEILEMVQTRKHNFLTSWMTGTGRYHEEAAEQDRFVVLNFLHNEGYADAQVDLQTTEPDDGKGILIKFVAVKGPRFKFGTVTFTGNELFTDEELDATLSFKKGETFSPEKLRAAVKEISDLYGEKGYIDTVVNFDPRLIPDKHIYNIDFEITQGDQCRVGLVRIFGNTRTQQRVILHESVLIPGEVFNIRRLQATEAKLMNIGYFDSVNCYAVRPRDDLLLEDDALYGSRYRDVYIELKECSTGEISLMFGYSSQDNGFIGLEVSERNFNIAGLPWMFRRGPIALRGAGEHARFRANLGKKQTQLLWSWTKPFFRDTRWIVGFDVDYSTNHRQSRDYTVQDIALTTSATYPFNRWTRIGYHYRLKYDTITLRGTALTDPKTRDDLKGRGIISGVGTTLTYDSVDYCHRKGLYSVGEAEYAGVLGDFRFLRFAYLNTYYQPIPWDWAILKLRADFRAVVPTWGQDKNALPVAERLFLGGETTIRGYAPYQVGPNSDNGDPLGGFTSLLLTAEINKPLNKAIDVFAFVDSGFVSGNVMDFSALRVTAGAGIRLKLGAQLPVVVGYGYAFNQKKYKDMKDKNAHLQPIFFSMGGTF